ncbi:MAG TPA: DUF1576 domain-containing protein [Tissierellaceae bacterium]|nr:DUF1576 domain-containing protein [Tissierellaceae bacterium]
MNLEGIKRFMAAAKRSTHKRELIVSQKGSYVIITLYVVIILLSSLLFNTPKEIILGMKKIVLAPSILLTDYMELANIGAALFNSGLIMLAAIIIGKYNKVNMSGPIVATILTIGGFGLFGKNIYNIWSIFLGVYLFSLTQKHKFNRYIVIAFFGTALGPLVSQISFGFDFSPLVGIVLGNLAGVVGGIILPALANHFVSFHQGFNLYNVGFTAGIIATFFMSMLRAFGFENRDTSIILQGSNKGLGIYFGIFFGSMILIGWILNGRRFRRYKRLLASSGRLVSDFITIYGFGLSLINMGILGIGAILYILIVKGDLNGITIGAAFTVVGFGAFGKHLRNTIPIVLGVYLASLLKIFDANSVTTILAALFGTTLAPIAGTFGWGAGILAGFLHSSVVMNVGYLHGGMNLYNNGFAGGLVAAVLVPIIESFRKDNDYEV